MSIKIKLPKAVKSVGCAIVFQGTKSNNPAIMSTIELVAGTNSWFIKTDRGMVLVPYELDLQNIDEYIKTMTRHLIEAED